MAVGEAGKLVIGTEIDTKQFDAQIKEVESKLEELEKYYEAALDPRAKEDPKAIQDLEVEIEKTKNKLVGLRQAKERANKTPIEDPKILGEINLNLSNIIKKVGKWALAVFSVRSAYLFVRSAVSTISQYDQQLGANIQYIRYALAMTIKPIVEWIVNAVYTLLQYINYISKAWFNVDLFANASAKSFNKANGSAKKLQRTMAGFDEMNVLSSNKDQSGGGAPSIDLSKQNVPIPGWVDWIAKNKDTILDVLKELAIVFGIAKLAEVSGLLGKIGGALGLTKTAGIWGAINGILMLGGLYAIFKVDEKIREDFDEMKEELENLYERSEKKVKESIKSQKSVNGLLKDQNVRLQNNNNTLDLTNTLYGKINGLHDEAVDNSAKSVEYQKDFFKRLQEIERETGITEDENKAITDYLLRQLDTNKRTQEELPKNGEQYKKIETANHQIIDYLYQQYDNLKKQGLAEDEIKEKIGYTRDELEEMVRKPYQAKIGIDDGFLNATWQTIKKWVDKIKELLNFQTHFSVSGTFSGYSAGSGKHALGGIIPYASGGIINRPGSGVPIGGEHGMEGVIPMTHEGQMQLLGETIAKYINVNLVNNTNLDGRLIARQINKVQNNTNFATNR